MKRRWWILGIVELLSIALIVAMFISIGISRADKWREPAGNRNGAPSPAPGEIPALVGPVNDYAGVISADRETQLTKMLLDQEAQTSNQIVILTVESLGNETIESYAVKVFRDWKLGDAEKDNGVLFVNATGERKVRIEVGLGLEGVLPDALASRIIENEIVPRFKEGDFDGGFLAGVTAIDAAIRGEYKADAGKSDSAWPLLFVMFIAIIIVLILFANQGKGGYHTSGGWSSSSSGSSGGGGGGYSGGGGSSGGGGASGGY